MKSPVRTGLATILVGAVLSTLLSGCMNNTNSDTSKTTSGAGSISSGSGGAIDGSNSNTSIISISQLLRSNADPTALLDLVGTSNQMGSQCSTDGSNGRTPAGSSDCQCVFDWTEPNGTFREASTAPVYVESNLLRCPFNVVTPTAQYFDLKLQIISAGVYSNSIRMFLGSANPSLDPSIAINYSPVQRYQCHDIFRKLSSNGQQVNTSFYQNTILDPRLWDMGNTYNLYTTSLGLDYGATAAVNADGTQTPVPGWECPPIPNDPTFDPAFDLHLYSKMPIDLNNPQNIAFPSPVITGQSGAAFWDNTIYPPDDDQSNPNCSGDITQAKCEKFKINRHDYYLANFMDGTFRQQVCLVHKVANFITPTLDCTVNTANGPAVIGSAALGKDIIGFAAIPDANENCPDPTIVKIPTGKKWAKLWQFRASIPKRKIMDVSNPSDIGDLFCTARRKECLSGTASPGAKTVCWDVNPLVSLGTMYPQSSTLQSASSGTRGYGNCDDSAPAGSGELDPPAGGFISPNPGSSCAASGAVNNCCHDNGSNAGNNNPANYTPNGNYCNPTVIGSHWAEDPNQAGGRGVASDNWLMGNGGRRACIEADTDRNGALVAGFWNGTSGDNFGTYQLSSRDLEQNSQSDVVYIVSPTSVRLANMQNPNDPIGQQYTPYRNMNTPGGVVPIPYNLDSGAGNGATGTTRLSQFPYCVLQDAK